MSKFQLKSEKLFTKCKNVKSNLKNYLLNVKILSQIEKKYLLNVKI